MVPPQSLAQLPPQPKPPKNNTLAHVLEIMQAAGVIQKNSTTAQYSMLNG
eukprot:CAMPEP_0195296476 /NCGR_PEP_ID=MMETSP0707-20130614/19569_1 /TAXON_ID=33640 /ORGANISM="Asterionellopsis glacialis, Strain CCMP134" /LENGTH=49 /DNA_ID= /DNA_START= /DNA_END= /DNA_ORIENTATION=